MPLYSISSNINRAYSREEAKAALARLKGVAPRRSNSSYTYNATPENYSGSTNSYNNQSQQRSHYESWCYTDSQGTTHEPIC